MGAFNLPKCMVVVMVVLLALESHSTIEAVRLDEIKHLLGGVTFGATILRAKLNDCTSCTVGCSQGCNSCTADVYIG